VILEVSVKHWKLTILLIFSVIFLQACDVTVSLGDSGGTKASVPLAVSVEAPAQGSQVSMGAMDIRYTATAPEGVGVVELNIDGYVVNSYTSPDPSQNTVALAYSWTPQMTGSHIIRVRVQDSKGTWSDYTDVMLTVTDSQAAAQSDQSSSEDQSSQPQPTNTPVPTATPSTPYIYAVTHSVDKFYYNNSTCGPTKITITLKVSDPNKVWSVVIFTRFMDKEGEGQSKWDTGHAMTPQGSGGEYSITLESSKITNFDTYDFAVFRYQFVATDKNRNEVARTEVYEDIEYSICP
jgi:hypothetical protein